MFGFRFNVQIFTNFMGIVVRIYNIKVKFDLSIKPTITMRREANTIFSEYFNSLFSFLIFLIDNTCIEIEKIVYL